MNIAGIVTEYNPFHNGHKFMIEQVKKKGADLVVAVMSGAVVQRGDTAIFDKHFRAKKAVENGVDLVLELPFPYSCSSAEIFGRTAIYILSSLGKYIINSIAFGCETYDINLLKKASEISENLKDNNLVSEKISRGKSYPTAVYESACELYGKDVADVLKSPNNTLAIEYIKAANHIMPWANFIPVKREYAQHDSDEFNNSISSASYIRNSIFDSKNVNELCPYYFNDESVFNINVMEREVLFRLSCIEKSQLLNLPDCSENIADRIIKTMSECPKSLEEFLQKCKSKNITMARLRRIIMYAVLGVTKSDLFVPPYVRVLAFNKKGTEILKQCKSSVLPISTSLKALENSSDKAKRIISLENNAVKFQQLCAVGEYNPKNEYSRIIRISE